MTRVVRMLVQGSKAVVLATLVVSGCGQGDLFLPEHGCGDQTCASGENCAVCPEDCGLCPPSCGDAVCGTGESCSSCPRDCGACPAACNDGTCTAPESCVDCPGDCGTCAPGCGDGVCEGGETCQACSIDCGMCPDACNDGTCGPTETCELCPDDCGVCPSVCGDAVCDADESCSSCLGDCGPCATPDRVGYGATVQLGTTPCVVSQPTESALRACLAPGNHVTFAQDTDITVASPIIQDGLLNLYLDGRGRSVTIRASGRHHILAFKREARHFMVDNIRFVGVWQPGSPSCNGCGVVELDGDPNNNQPIRNYYFRNSTFLNDPDGGPQPFAGNKDATFDRLLIADGFHPFGHGSTTQSPEGDGRARERLTSYMLVLARNGERQPQLREGVWDVDFVSSIIYDWKNYTDLVGNGPGGTGLVFRDDNVHRINVIGNAFIPDPVTGWHAAWGCMMGSTAATNNGQAPSDSYYAGNLDTGTECAQRAGEFSRSVPVVRPYTLPTVTLGDTLDQVGAFPRTPYEQALVDEIRAQLP